MGHIYVDVEIGASRATRRVRMLVNTGATYTIIPPQFANEIGLVRNYFLPRALEASLVEDIRTEAVLADAVISDIEEEVLISDKLTGRLGIILEDVAEGIYALKADSDRRPRRSYPLRGGEASVKSSL